jgi:Flp pilus assembly protein TadG
MHYRVPFMKIRDQKGQSLVELALILPLLAMILGGLVDLGILFYDHQVLANASREGARAGVVYELDSGGNKIIPNVGLVVQNYCQNKRLITFGGTSTPTTTTSPAVSTLNYPGDLTVTVNFQYTFLLSAAINIFGGNLGPTMNISATTVMKAE